MSLSGAGLGRLGTSHLGLPREELDAAVWRTPSVIDGDARLVVGPPPLDGQHGFNPLAVTPPEVRTVTPTHAIGSGDVFNDQDVNGILAGPAWKPGAGETHLTLTFSFPTSATNYGATYYDTAAIASLQPLSAAQQDVVRYAFNLISSYTGITFKEMTETDTKHATLRLAGSANPPTSYAYYPSTDPVGGDAFFGNIRNDDPTKAGYAFDTFLHEIGHAMGLKHGQQADATFGTLPADHNSTEWSTMTYYSYVGTPDDFYSNAEGSGNQTYMMDDIAALQYIYGANYTSNAGATVYTWSPTTGEEFINGVGQGASSTNTIYGTIWDGGGSDTYDLSNYRTRLDVTLQPGQWSTFDAAQLADLDGYTDLHTHYAHGNVANAHMFDNDPASLIENVLGGKGSDRIEGNLAANDLVGAGGRDQLSGLDGADTLLGGNKGDILTGGAGADLMSGGKGDDIFRFKAVADSTPGAQDHITDLAVGDTIDLTSIDADGAGTKGNGAFVMVDAFDGHAGELTVSYDRHAKVSTIAGDTDGDSVANFSLLVDGDQRAFDGYQL